MFVIEYAKDLNAQRAYVAAGYRNGDNTRAPYRMLAYPKVRKALAAIFDKRGKETGIDAKVVIGELYRLARVDPGLAYNADGTMKPMNEIPEDVRRALAGIDSEETFVVVNGERVYTGRIRKAKFWDKNRSLELLAKHLGLLIDRTESNVRITGDPAEPIVYRAQYGVAPALPAEKTTNGHATNGNPRTS